MATDKKSQHVGNHGGRYTDMDGMSKQFTYIDHDKKTSISTGLAQVDPNFSQTAYREELIKRITEMPASLCPGIFYDYTLRGEGKTTITWNMDMLIDRGVPLNQLRDLANLLENASEINQRSY
jgi:hypothetical protein